MMPTPDFGSYHPKRPNGYARPASDLTAMAAAGQTLGAHMWFHEDMVHALTNGRTANGWTGGHDDHGRPYLRLTILGVTHTWIITGQTDCDQIPGTVLMEGTWPD
jgi:hypothetical protein